VLKIQKFTLTYKSDRINGVHIWRAVQREGSWLTIWPKPRVLPPYSWLWKEQGESEVSGWWRDAGKLNLGESTEFIIDK